MDNKTSLPPIDLVIPMVFPQDPDWQREYARSSGIDATRNVRFRSWGTEELLVQCCRKYMPWLRTIHILLASESQTEFLPGVKDLAGCPQVRFVFHRDFVPENLLPCFNINTVEMFLHKIPGLPEHFIYSNDDFFPLSPLQESDFFQPSGNSRLLPCQHMDEKPYPDPPNIFHRFVMSGLNMVAEDFGLHFTTTWLKGGHSMQPMLRSTVEKVCTRHADRIGHSFTFRRTDRNFNQYIFPFYQHFSGEYIDHVPTRKYVGPNADIGKIVGIIRRDDAGIVCLNDHESIEDWEQRAEAIRREIAEKVRTS